jgi:hypothetical protein
VNKIGAFSRSSPEHVEQTRAPGACSGACSNSSLLRSRLLRSSQNNLCSGALLRSTGAKMSAPGCSGAQLLRSSACAPMPWIKVILHTKYGADRRQFLIRNYLRPRRKRIFDKEKYGADRRQLLIRKHIWPRQ